MKFKSKLVISQTWFPSKNSLWRIRAPFMKVILSKLVCWRDSISTCFEAFAPLSARMSHFPDIISLWALSLKLLNSSNKRLSEWSDLPHSALFKAFCALISERLNYLPGMISLSVSLMNLKWSDFPRSTLFKAFEFYLILNDYPDAVSFQALFWRF